MLIFSFDYPPNDGGIARLSAELARGLISRGFPVHVLSQHTGNLPEIDPKIETTRVVGRRPQREIRAFLTLRAMKNTDLCISGIWYPDGLLAQLAGFRSHVILAHSAELYPPIQSWRRLLWKFLQRFVLENSSLVIANSHYTAQLVESVAPKAKIIALPLAVDHYQFCPQDRTTARSKWQVEDDQTVLCTVARVHRFKGHETVLKALASLAPQMRKKFIYLIAGKGPDIAYFQTWAESLGIADQVRWLGFVTDEDLPSLYSASDLFVLATREIPGERSVEGFGLAFLESQACGTAVVGTNTGGIPDAVSHGDGGLLIEQDDVKALTKILLELHDRPEDFRIMGEKARLRVEREFTWNHYIDHFLEALKSQGIQIYG